MAEETQRKQSTSRGDVASDPTLRSSDSAPGRPPSHESGTAPAGSAQLPVEGEVILGKYRVDGLLGQGGMGVVYRATHCMSDKSVAVKWMLPVARDGEAARDRFMREARATARIDHPNVVDIYDVGLARDSAYLVMELLRGESLARRIEREPMSPSNAIATLMPAMRGVAAAHDGGVIHRDLKPDNIFLCVGPAGEPREAKVLDFGISKIGDPGETRPEDALTRSGMVMGTPYYMSPEQVRGIKAVDERGDIYAFGVILYEMFTDSYPFQGETYNQLILQIATADPVPIRDLNPDVPEALAEVVMRAMAREPADRFQSVRELALALEPFADGVTFDRRPSSPSGRAFMVTGSRVPPVPAARPSGAAVVGDPRLKGRRRVLIGLGLVALVALGFAVLRASGESAQEARSAPTPPLVRPAASVATSAVSGDESNTSLPSSPASAASQEATTTTADTLPQPAAAPPLGIDINERRSQQARERARQARRQRRAAARAVGGQGPGAATQNVTGQAGLAAPAEPARLLPDDRNAKARRLPADWDERLMPKRSGQARVGKATPGNLAGELTLDDL